MISLSGVTNLPVSLSITHHCIISICDHSGSGWSQLTSLNPDITDNKVERLRDDLWKLFQWGEDWQMMFNVDKCSVLHFGYNNARVDLELGGKPLMVHGSERDLGVMVQSDLKVDQ